MSSAHNIDRQWFGHKDAYCPPGETVSRHCEKSASLTNSTAFQSAALLRALLLLAFVMLAPVGVLAQSQSAPPATPSAAAPAAPGVAGQAPAPAAELQDLLKTLENPAERAKLTESLRLLLAAQRSGSGETAENGTPATSSNTGSAAAAPASQAPAPAATPAPAEPAAQEGPPPLSETFGVKVIAFLGDQLDMLRNSATQSGKSLEGLKSVPAWANSQWTVQSARERLREIGILLAAILVLGYGGRHVISRIVSRPRRAFAARPQESLLHRLPQIIGRALLDLVPIIGFIAITYAVMSVYEPGPRARLVVLAIVNASVILQLSMLVVRVLLSPDEPRLGLLHLSGESGQKLYVGVRRLLAVSIYGYFLIEALYILGLSLGAYGALMKLLGLAVSLLLIKVILNNRNCVADWIRGNSLTGKPSATEAAAAAGMAADTRREEEGALVTARSRFADFWHVLAIGYVAITYVIWVLNVYGGFEYLLRATALTLVAVVAARVLVNGFSRVVIRLWRRPESRPVAGVGDNTSERFLELTFKIIKVMVWGIAVMVVLSVWGVNSFGWIDLPVGRRILSSLVTILIILGLAALAWRVVNTLIERFLAAEVNGTRVHRSARVRTLLPLLRNAFLVVLVTMVSLITLSELGINIAPLLAGAGVIGLAVGFGAQTLVKDIITGLFILLEDTISIGDSVVVGSGHSGTVEAMSIRSIRLRDGNGGVHTVPFSSVTTITNNSKDFSYANFSFTLSLQEDPERVAAILQDVGNQLREDPRFSYDLLGGLEVLGVDKLTENGAIMLCRFKTRATRQSGVAREFNLRVRKRFDEERVDLPTQTMRVMNVIPAQVQPLEEEAAKA